MLSSRIDLKYPIVSKFIIMCRFSKKAFCLLATASASTIASVRHERRKRRINYGTTPWVNVNIDSRSLAALSRGQSFNKFINTFLFWEQIEATR